MNNLCNNERSDIRTKAIKLKTGDGILISENNKTIASHICNSLTKKYEGTLYARVEINKKYYIKRIK